MTNLDPNSTTSVDLLLAQFCEYPVCQAAKENLPGLSLTAFADSSSEPVINHTDKVLAQLCDAYISSPDTVRSYIRERMVATGSCVHFAGRAAIRLLRGGQEIELQRGLTALLVDDLTFDDRETLVGLAMLQLAATRRDLDFAAMANAACDRASPSMATFLLSQMDRLSFVQSGLLETTDKNGLTLKLRARTNG